MKQEKIWAYHQLQADAETGIFAGSGQRYAFLAAQLSRDQQVLNIGVGRGGLERALLARGCTVYSLDPIAGSIEHLRSTLAMGERAQVGYSQQIPFPDAAFDVVILSEVLEHLDAAVLAATLGEVERVLKVGGRFLGTVPAEEELANSRCVCPSCGEVFHRWGHVRSFDRQALTELLTSRFQAVTIQRHYFYAAGSLNWKGRLEAQLKKLLLASGRDGSNETFSFLATKA